MRQAISVYEAVGNNDINFPWPADLVLYYQTRLLEKYALMSVSRPVSASTMRGLVDTVRNRTLSMALELKEGSEDSGNQGKLTTKDSDKISQAITHNVFNGPAYFASGEAQLNVSNDASQQSNIKGNKKALDEALLSSGLSKAEVDELGNVLTKDSFKLGANTQSWISRVAPQICKDGVKAGVSVATSLLNEWLKSYLGLP